jgi:hypothetical protein
MNMKRMLTLVGIGALLACSFPEKGVASTSPDRAAVIPASPDEMLHKEAVFSFLQDYFSALAQGEIEKLAVYHPTLTSEQLALLHDYFAHTIRDLHIRLEQVRVNVVANTATIGFYRTDQFIDRPTGRRIQKSIQLSTMLVQGANGWKLAGVDQVAFALAGDRTSVSS